MIFGVWCSMIVLPICFDIEMPNVWYITLPLATWAIYLTDHLIDVYRTQVEHATPRHQYVKTHTRQIAILVFLLCSVVIYFLVGAFHLTVFICGAILSVFVALHFILVRINPQKKWIANNKELAVACIYAMGIYSVPLLVKFSSGETMVIPMICFLLFLALVFMNLLMVSIIEFDIDKQLENSTWVIAVSKENAQKILTALFGTIMFVLFIVLQFVDLKVKLLLTSYFIIAIGHLIIFINRNRLQHYLLYRKLSEGLFWVPGLIYFLA